MSKNPENKKPRLHTTISKETEELIEKYVNFTDKNNEVIYGNKSRVIEKAIELLNKYHNPEKEDILTLWSRSRDEVNMALIGKWTFLSFITGDYKNLINENIAVDLIEWYKQKQIDDLSILEILNAIKEIWVAANYFINIDIKIGSRGTFQMSLFHDFNNREYSEYWGKYFTMLLLKRKKYDVEYFTRISSLILRIKDISEQEETVAHKEVKREFLKKRGVPFFDGKGNFVGYFFKEKENSKIEQNDKRINKYEKKNL